MEVSGVDSVPAGLRYAPPKNVDDVEKEMRRLLTPRAPLMAAPPPAIPYPGMQPFNPAVPGGLPVVPGMMAPVPGALPGMAMPVPVVLPPGATPAAAVAAGPDVDPLEGRNVDPTKKDEILRTV